MNKEILDKKIIIESYLKDELERITDIRKKYEKDVTTLKREISHLLSIENEIQDMICINDLKLQNIDTCNIDMGNKLFLHCKNIKR